MRTARKLLTALTVAGLVALPVSNADAWWGWGDGWGGIGFSFGFGGGGWGRGLYNPWYGHYPYYGYYPAYSYYNVYPYYTPYLAAQVPVDSSTDK
ncbi:MAG: sulfur globule protein CV3 [Candidatus Sedimenticola sp. PURPLELP]